MSALCSPRKRYDEEEPNTPAWAAHRKHFFILSSAGKPIFSRFGDESKLSPVAGVLQALVSFVDDSGDTIRHVRVGAHRVVFLMRGPLYLVAVSTCGDTVEYLWQQLHYLHAQIISILTSKVEQIFARNASFDLRGLLGGTDRVIRSLIRYANAEPSLLFNAVPSLRLPPPVRAELGKVLAARPADLLFAVMVARSHLVHLYKAKKSVLHPQDVLLVMNTVASSSSFREDESWLPICLPCFNDKGFVYAHVSFVAEELCLVLITPKADAFSPLSAFRQQVMQRLEAMPELLGTLRSSISEPQYRVDEFGVPEVRHFIYKLNAVEQLSAPRLGPDAGPQCPYRTRDMAKGLFRVYQHAHALIHGTSKPLRELLVSTATETVIARNSGDAELYVVFSPLVSKPVAIAACQKLHRSLKKEHASLFLLSTAK